MVTGGLNKIVTQVGFLSNTVDAPTGVIVQRNNRPCMASPIIVFGLSRSVLYRLCRRKTTSTLVGNPLTGLSIVVGEDAIPIP